MVSRKVWWWLGVKKGQKKKMLIKGDRRAAPRGLASTAGRMVGSSVALTNMSCGG